MQVIHSIASVAASHGGPSRSVPAVCDALVGIGVESHLITGVGTTNRDDIFPVHATTHKVVDEARTGRFTRPYGFRKHLRALCGQGSVQSVIHDHGLWLQTNHAVAVESRRLGVPRVVSPRGMLSKWSMNRRKSLKRALWMLYQKRDLASAAAFHATSEEEAGDIRKLGFTQPIAVIPNGVEVPVQMPDRSVGTLKPCLLCLARIHPVKGLENLLHAFQQTALHRKWKLILAGPDESGHRRVLESLAHRLGLNDAVHFTGSVDAEQKWQLMADADIFVLPSFTENFGIAIAEAMAAGLPVITTTGTPWAVLNEQKMGWWVAPEIEALKSSLLDATALSTSERLKMGAAARQFVSDNLAWDTIAVRLRLLYESLV